MTNHFIKNNIPLVAIIIFVIVFYVIQNMKPSFLYKTDGTMRDFGVGYKQKTFMPVWLFSIILGILSYLGVMYYIHIF
jgi:hypothetical protein